MRTGRPVTPKEMTLMRMSPRLLVDARLHVSFSFPFLFSFPFTLYRKLEKNTPISSTVIFFVKTGEALSRNCKGIKKYYRDSREFK